MVFVINIFFFFWLDEPFRLFATKTTRFHLFLFCANFHSISSSSSVSSMLFFRRVRGLLGLYPRVTPATAVFIRFPSYTPAHSGVVPSTHSVTFSLLPHTFCILYIYIFRLSVFNRRYQTPVNTGSPSIFRASRLSLSWSHPLSLRPCTST